MELGGSTSIEIKKAAEAALIINKGFSIHI